MAPTAGRTGANGRGAAVGRGGGPMCRPAGAGRPAVTEVLRGPAASGRGAGGDSARPPSVLRMRRPTATVPAIARDGAPKVSMIVPRLVCVLGPLQGPWQGRGVPLYSDSARGPLAG